jgi:hypothetical protein
VAFPALWLALAGTPKNQVQQILRTMQHKALPRITKQRTGVAGKTFVGWRRSR